jgi:hypothetical protein
MHTFKTLKNGIPIGTIIPFKQWNGNIGIWAEDQLEANGHVVNRSRGPDLFDGLEVKTRNLESDAPYTIGTMSRKDIVRTPYADSVIWKKCQQWYLVTFNDSQSIVADSRILDLSDKHTQQLLEHDYEMGRTALINNKFKTYTGSPDTCWGYFEQRRGYPNSFRFRVSNLGINSLMDMNNKPVFHELFTFAP